MNDNWNGAVKVLRLDIDHDKARALGVTSQVLAQALRTIMQNSVIPIDPIEPDRARGVPAWDAIVESALRRFRPIVLTAAGAVRAVVPLSRGVFWGPMDVAIMGG